MDVFKAAEKGDVCGVDLCLSEGTDVNSVDGEGCTVLYVATRYNQVDVMQWLLHRGADTEITERINGWTALIYAASRNTLEAARLLVEHGAVVNVQNKRGQTALCVAVCCGHNAIAKLLIDRGADVNICGKDGENPIQQAAKTGNTDITDMLIKAEAIVEGKTFYDGFTPLLMACRHNHITVADLLLKRGVKVNPADNKGNTALHWAAANSNLEMVKSLIKHKAACLKNKEGQTALDIAEAKQSSDVRTELEEYFHTDQSSGASGASGASSHRAESSVFGTRPKSATAKPTAVVRPFMKDELKSEVREESGAPREERDLRNRHLMMLACKFGDDWKSIGAALGLSVHLIERLVMDHAPDFQFAAFGMLSHWRNGQVGSLESKKAGLREAFRMVDRADLLSEI